jgi:anaerobic ribonucleoside-triphosphate reductase activating protein
LSVWVYTGYSFEDLIIRAGSEQAIKELLHHTDVLIDEPFLLAGRTLSLKWRGSKNQRMLDIPKSIAANQAIELTKGE